MFLKIMTFEQLLKLFVKEKHGIILQKVAVKVVKDDRSEL